MARRAVLAFATIVVCALGTTATVTSNAAEGEKDQCINAADQGQQFRDENKYRVARDAFVRCSNESCPTLVKQECAQWLRDLDEQAPTVVFAAQDSKGNDLTDVDVTMDDAPLISKLDGKPTVVDPGEHVFHYDAVGFSPTDERVVIHAGEKNRVVKATFQTNQETPTTTETGQPTSARARSSPAIVTWVFGGVALAAFASEAYFGLSGIGDRTSALALGGCAPHCSDSQVSSIQTKFIVADVSLGVGIVSAGLATYFFLTSRGSTAPVDTALDFSPRPGGGVATVGGRF